MQILSRISALGAASLLLAAPAQGQRITEVLPTPQDTPNRQGSRGANFLHLGIGARGAAMAGSVGSSVGGPVAWYWNPAGAATSEGLSIVAGLQKLYEELDIKQSYVAINLPILGGVVGLNLNTLNSGKMNRTTELNPFGERLGGSTFSWTSNAAGLGYARRLTDKLSVGGQVKYIREGITDAGTTWLAGDVGTQFNTGLYGLVIGGSIQNIGGTSRASGALLSRVVQTTDGSVIRENRRVDIFTLKTEIPVEFRFSLGADLFGSANAMFGGAGNRNTVSAEFSASDATDYSTQYGLGVEYGFRNMLFLRGGKRIYNDQRDIGSSSGTYGLAGGFGVRVPLGGRNVKFDYSYQGVGLLQNIQIFSFEVGR